jgi:uncharacterized protein YjbJ (UPF0337 family)
MNMDIWLGKWRQLKGTLQERWGQLTHDDLDVVRGDQEMLTGRIQERYGLAREEAEKLAGNSARDRDELDDPPKDRAGRAGGQ